MPAVVSIGALLICLCLTGCGGSGSGDRPPAAPGVSDAEQAAATVRRQMQAVARGDGTTACTLFSSRALAAVQEEVSRRAGDIGCVTAVEQGAGRLPRDVRAALRRPRITRVEVNGDRATVAVRLPARVSALARRLDRGGGGIPLRRVDGRWRVDGLHL